MKLQFVGQAPIILDATWMDFNYVTGRPFGRGRNYGPIDVGQVIDADADTAAVLLERTDFVIVDQVGLTTEDEVVLPVEERVQLETSLATGKKPSSAKT